MKSKKLRYIDYNFRKIFKIHQKLKLINMPNMVTIFLKKLKKNKKIPKHFKKSGQTQSSQKISISAEFSADFSPKNSQFYRPKPIINSSFYPNLALLFAPPPAKGLPLKRSAPAKKVSFFQGQISP